MSYEHLNLKILEGDFKYVLLNPTLLQQLIPRLEIKAPSAIFLSADEISAVIPSDVEIANTKSEPGWSCIRIIGEMPFGSVPGLISTISSILKAEGVGVCVVSTYLTDWFFIRTAKLDKAVELLTSAGWKFVSRNGQ